MIKYSKNEINESHIKINRRNFENITSRNAIFKDNHQNLENIPRGSASLIDLNEDKIDIKSIKF